jgi:hypothetical protein
MRPSRAGPKSVNTASVSSSVLRMRVPPICSVFLALPGAESELRGVATFVERLPVLKTTSRSGCDQTNASTSYADCG